MTNDASAGLRCWLVLASCCLSLLLVMMDVTIVNVVLPSIRLAFHTDIARLQWVVDAYTLTVAALLMAAGSLADRFGRKRVFMSGIAVFCVASALCGMAASPAQMVAGRVLQGIGGAMLNPVALSIITNTFLEPKARANAIGIWGMMSGLALALGPTVGGFVTEHWGWRAVFWINLPVGVVALLMTSRFVTESRAPVSRKLDATGQGLAALGVVSLVAALIEGPDYGWGHPLIGALFGLAAGAGTCFYLWEKRIAEPMLDFRFFRSIPFSAATVLAVLCFSIFSAMLFLNTIYLQDIRGLMPANVGRALMPFAVAVMLCAPVSGWLVGAVGARVPLLLSGAGLSAGSMMLASLKPDVSWSWLEAAYFLVGTGFGLCNAPITNAAVSGMPRAQAGLAAAIASTSRQVGAALGVAVAGSIRGSGLGQAGGEGFAAAFLALSHPVFWASSVLGVGVILTGFVATGKAATASAARVAQNFMREI